MTKEEIELKLDEIRTRFEEIATKRMFLEDYDDYKDYDEEENYLRSEYEKYTIMLEGLIEADYSDGELDLVRNKRKTTNKQEYYDIRLTNTLTYIGRIRITYLDVNPLIGNIGYELRRNYRGNGYMIKALNMLKNRMIEMGLIHPTLTVYPDNIASIKTIEKFGGELIEKKKRFDTYQVDLEEDSKKSLNH